MCPGDQFFGYVFNQLLFSLKRVFGMAGQTNPFRDPEYMGVNGHCGFVINDRGDHIGRFAAYPRQLLQVGYIVGHHPVKLPGQDPGHAREMFCFVVGIGTAADVVQYLLFVGLGHGLWCGKALHKGRGDHVDPFVGALRREDHRHYQFKWVVVL